MTDIGVEGLEPNPESPERLHDYLALVENSRQGSEQAVIDFLERPKNPLQVSLAFGNLSLSLRRTLNFVLENDEYPSGEKAGLVAYILQADDEQRVSFLSTICDETESGIFRIGYPEFDSTKDGIGEVFEESEDVEESLDILIGKHMELMEADLNLFFQTNFVKDRLQKGQWQEELYGRLRDVGTIALGVATGIILAKILDRRKA